MEEVNILEIINISIAVKPMLGLNSIDNIACKIISKMEDRAEEIALNTMQRDKEMENINNKRRGEWNEKVSLALSNKDEEENRGGDYSKR